MDINCIFKYHQFYETKLKQFLHIILLPSKFKIGITETINKEKQCNSFQQFGQCKKK